MTQTTKKPTKKSTPKKRRQKYSQRARRLQREMILSVLLILLVGFLIVKFHTSPNTYQVVVFDEQNQMEEVQYYTNFKTAKKAMQEQVDDGGFNPAILDEEGRILAIRYGIVNFRTKTCGENTSYLNDRNQKNGYTNGCYGGDGAYLDTDDDASFVKFKQSGVIGWVEHGDVELLNYFDSTTTQSVNHYAVKEGSIYHQGTTDPKGAGYEIDINIGKNEMNLPAEPLYSYDGHYFYQDFTSMIDDYRKETYANSINAKTPYFNYYQYLTHRAKTSYVSKELNWYITSYLGYTGKPNAFPPNQFESQLYDEGFSFVDTQNKYGTNALMMLALAINESGFGRSQISIEKNNLFGHAAYDNAPNESASGYKDVASSITTHAQIFLNQGYLNPCDQADPDSDPSPSTCLTQEGNRYMGGYFGDKESGMNVNYASDPYWGEKAAQYYRSMDELLGDGDASRFTIKILHNRMKTPMYSLPDTNAKVIFYSPMVENYAVVLLEEIKGEEVDGSTTWYKVQSDAALNSSRNAMIPLPDSYNYKNDIVYIPESNFKP